jgi:demethylmenaquinone methyltransferase/2-methoxy-6-polyprenyl-1,4-benzoquinol methylase
MVKPYANLPGTHKEQVKTMFDSISGKYDFLNHFLSFGSDIRWRKKLAGKLVALSRNRIQSSRIRILDVATGTGDMAFELSKLPDVQIAGIDIAAEMLEIAKAKADSKRITNVGFTIGDAENLGYLNNEFDYVTVTFGIRNFAELERGLKEIHRVLKTGGALLILEFSVPKGFFGVVYKYYSGLILPLLAGAFTRHKHAYKYLPESIYRFPAGPDLCLILKNCGFSGPEYKGLSMGITNLYWAVK